MINLYILTTAITRPTLHNESIGVFYEKIYKPNKSFVDKHFCITHVINIDCPEKLMAYFTVGQTVENFKRIIPSSITLNLLFEDQSGPAFLDAFKRIMDYIDKLSVYGNNNLFWWFEDDWKFDFDNGFFQNLMFLYSFKSSAMTLTPNSQLGSFRGGPVMSEDFFLKYFNIQRLKQMNCSCDPERQVVNYISMKGIQMENGTIIVRARPEHETIRLILVYINVEYSKITPDFGIGFYQKKYDSGPKPNFIYEYYIIVIKSCSWNVFEYMKYEPENNAISSVCTVKENYKMTTLNELNQMFNYGINYFIVKPYCLNDCGREFAQKYNLIKGWVKYGDITTYS